MIWSAGFPAVSRPITFAGVDFRSDDEETQKTNYSKIDKKLIHPVEVRKKIKEHLLESF